MQSWRDWGKPGNSSVHDVFGSATGIGGAFTGNGQNQRGQRLQPDYLGRFPAQDLRQYGLLCQPHCVASAGDFNNPEIIRRLGVIALNVGLEFDIYGHANSTHVAGVDLMNGIGGSGDFERNAYLSIFMAPSIAKEGKISTVVPMCSHVDHSEHSVKVIITEQGIADLRGLSPLQRARTIIDNCAHPMYRDYLHRYLENAPGGHIHHDLSHVFDLHRNLIATGSMLG